MTLTNRLSIAHSHGMRTEDFIQWLQTRFDVTVAPGRQLPWGRITEVDIDDEEIRAILDAAESGQLDEQVRIYGGGWIQVITRGPKDSHHFDAPRLYDFVPTDITFDTPQFKSVSTAELHSIVSTIDLLVLTTTQVEREALYTAMAPLPGYSNILEGALHHATYHLGVLGRYRIAQVESTMSGEGRDGSPLTILDAIKEIRPKAIIVVGIAFGVDRVRQRLGDVIVAETVVPYEFAKASAKIVPRGQPLACGPKLSERFRTRRQDWNLARGTESVAVHQGTLLSGAKLIDNQDFRDSLLTLFPGALGGEMEGAGAYAAAARESTEVILVKGICDWADGHKNYRAQPFASHAAVSLVRHILSKEDVLLAVGARDIAAIESAKSSTQPAATSRFIGRDAELAELNRLHAGVEAVYLHGLHGMGKTSLVREYARRATATGGKTHYVNFQHTAVQDSSLADGFLPRKPADTDLDERLWRQVKKLGTLGTDDIVIFDELEALLYHVGEIDLIRFLRTVASLADRAKFEHDFNVPSVVVIGRQNWPQLEWQIAHDSPMLGGMTVVPTSPLSFVDRELLIRSSLGRDANTSSFSIIHALAVLSGGIPLLIREWARVLAAGLGGNQEASEHATYATLIHLTEWYFRALWQGLSITEQRTVISAMVRHLGYTLASDEEFYPTVHADELGATSAAFCWWLMRNDVRFHQASENGGRAKSAQDQFLLGALDELRSIKTVPALINAWIKNS